MINIRKKFLHTDDTPLVPLTEAGKANGTASTSSTAKTRSRPNNEYVLYSYGEPVGMTNDGGTSYFGTDILGSVRSVTDKYGAVQADYSYDAFGSPYLGNLENDVGFGYCGKVYDNGTGLYDYGFRDYSPVSARFTTIDPIRDGSNWFSYVVNDPVNYVDPLGLTATDSKGGNVTFNQNVFSNPFVGYNEPQVTFETSSQTNNSYYGIDIGNSITVACGSMSTIGNCFGSKANKGFSLNNGTTLGHNDVYIAGQNNESQSSKMIKQASIEFFIGSFLDICFIFNTDNDACIILNERIINLASKLCVKIQFDGI